MTNNEAQPTRIKTATVSVTLSHNSNYFKVELGIENETGLSLDEIDSYRLEAHELAEQAIDDHKNKLQSEIQVRVNGRKDTTTVESIEKLPLWNELKGKVKANSKK